MPPPAPPLSPRLFSLPADVLRRPGVPAGSRGNNCDGNCYRNTMPRLPVLTSANNRSEAAWHAYIRRVYHQTIAPGQALDLNTFNWFYADEAVNALLSSTPCLQVCVATINDWLYEGTLWTGRIGPEVLWPQLGFFVARAFPDPAAMPFCDKLEVMHAQTNFLGWEVGVSWFFHTIGSGVFLDCHNLPTNGGIAAYPDRTHIPAFPGGDSSPGIAEWMDQRNLAMLVITHANFWMAPQGPDAGNPRTEIIVRQRQLGSNGDYRGGVAEVSEPHRSCLTDAEYGFTFTTGVAASAPCQCRPTDHLNCELSG